MATYPLHGSLIQEQRAGACLESVAADSVVLEQEGGLDAMSGGGSLEGGVLQLKNENYDTPFTLMSASDMSWGFAGYRFRDIVIGGNIESSTPLGLGASSISFNIDPDLTPNAVPGGSGTAFMVQADTAGNYVTDFYYSIVNIHETSSSPKSWSSFNWNAGNTQFEIGVQWRSGGVQKDLAFCADAGLARWKIAFAAGGHFLAAVDNTVNIGAVGANRPAQIFVAPSTTAHANINLAPGVAPTSPVDGDIWFEATGLKVRIGGVTKTVTVV